MPYCLQLKDKAVVTGSIHFTATNPHSLQLKIKLPEINSD